MKKILIVDDEKISLMMTEHILSTQYATICASSGAEAIELYDRERPNLILTDLRMPGMTGFELINNLHSRFGQTVPVMFMTADGSDETESRGFDSGAVDYIRKPFRADILLRRIDNILQNADRIEGLTQQATTDPMTGLLNKASSQLSIDKV
ncbi:MAG: response regulator, partial [Lachnospiraceae bacterium]|nr:response regulator [Lachnospiraceae bacterium]